MCYDSITAMKTLPFLLLFALLLTAVSRAADVSPEITITSPAKFEIQNGFTRLLFSQGDARYSLSWAVQQPGQELTSYYPVILQPGETYTFTLRDVKTPSTGGHEIALLEGTLARISRGDNVVYDREVCEVHHAKMQLTDVPILYGLPGKVVGEPAPPPYATAQKLFPHQHTVYFGGCIVGPGEEKTKKLLVCAECRAAYQKWLQEAK
jgi:hypothetical protein